MSNPSAHVYDCLQLLRADLAELEQVPRPYLPGDASVEARLARGELDTHTTDLYEAIKALQEQAERLDW